MAETKIRIQAEDGSTVWEGLCCHSLVNVDVKSAAITLELDQASDGSVTLKIRRSGKTTAF